MNRCDEIRPLLAAYLDDELSEPEREQVCQHVAVCDQCTAELREAEESAALLGRLGEAEPPVTLAAGLRQRMRRRASGLIVVVLLALLAVLPAGAIGQIALRGDLPIWARAGFGLSAACFGAGLVLLVVYLLRQLRHLLIYAYLSGGKR